MALMIFGFITLVFVSMGIAIAFFYLAGALPTDVSSYSGYLGLSYIIM